MLCVSLTRDVGQVCLLSVYGPNVHEKVMRSIDTQSGTLESLLGVLLTDVEIKVAKMFNGYCRPVIGYRLDMSVRNEMFWRQKDKESS